MTSVLLRHLAPDLAITVVARSAHVARALEDLGADQALSAEELLGHLIAKSMEAPHAAALMRNMVDSDRYRLSENDLPANLAGLRPSEARSSHHELVLALVHRDEVTMGVNSDPTVESGEQLIVLRPSAPARSS